MMSTQPYCPPAPVFSLAFWRAYGVQMRPYLLFVSGITGLVGLAFAPAIPMARLLLLALVFFLSYGFGQAVTDCFQMDTDALSAPYRPLTQGRLRRRDVLGISLIGLVVCGVVLGVSNPRTLPLVALCMAGIVTYTPFKRRWWGGPFYNAWIVAVLFLIGVLSAMPATSYADLAQPAVLATMGAVFFGYANFVLTGYYKDVSADRATGYETVPVRFGLRVSSVASDGLALLMLACGGGALFLTLAEHGAAFSWAAALLFAAAGLAMTLVAQVRLHRVRREDEAHRAIGPVVHAYLLVLAALAAAHQPAWAPALAVFYMAFVGTMWRRPMAAQI